MDCNGTQEDLSGDHTNDSSSLLRLPPSLRHKICIAACMTGRDHSAFIDLNHRKRFQAGIQNGPPHPTTIPWNLTHRFQTAISLFLTCKLIYRELAPIVYGTNHFYINYNDFANLRSLRRLSDLAVRSLRKLTIHLNVVRCGLGNVCDGMLYWSSPDGTSEHVDDRTGTSLKLDEPNTALALEEWRRVWTEKIQPNLIQPAQLELNLICDVNDTETGLKAVKPLLDAPSSMLAGCSVRLCQRTNAELQELAEATVHHSTWLNPPQSALLHPAPGSAFRFFDLPAEIQHHILTFTDLITPFQEIEWSPLIQGLRWRYKILHSIGETQVRGIHGRYLRDLRFARREGVSYRGCWESSYPDGCYCRAFHAASSNVYPCQCWIQPTALFLVNKAFHNLAMEIFFGSNRFIVTPDRGATWTKVLAQRPTQPKLSASIFLSSILPTSTLPFLRSVELVFPPFGKGGPFDYCAPNSPTWQDWVRTLDYIKDKLTLSSLTIRVIFAPFLPRFPGPPRWAWMNDGLYQDWIRRQKKSYMDVILPMKRLRGLRAFFVELSVPEQCTLDIYQGQMVRLTELEEEAERVVMGWKYDAIAAGKGRVRDSVWKEMHRLTENA